ncbi:MAG TPA: ABC transporter permease [Thermoanaerobaculia bacterium]|nr:ABC transporter permease [Thermoanaerobaculia bacterium]
MAGWIDDLRNALRTLAKSPGFTLVALLTLALGIGANAAIFSVVQGVLLRPLPYTDAERIVAVAENDRLRQTEREGVSLPDYLDLRERSGSFTHLAALRGAAVDLARPGAESERIAGAAVTHELFPLLGVRPLLGRTFTAAEDRPGSERVVVLGEELWRQRFAAAPGVLGRALVLDGAPHTIVGVVPAAVAVPSAETELWRPLAPDAATAIRGVHDLRVLGKLRPGTSLAAARAETAAIARRLEQEYPDDNLGRGIVLEPLREALFGRVRPALLVLMGAVGLVLLIACVNVANLLLARAADRGREVAIRAALGAGRWRLARQFLAEALLLAALAGAGGLLLAWLALGPLLALAPQDVPRLAEVRLDARVLAFTAAAALATALVFGLVPLLQSFGRDLQAALKSGGAATASTGGRARWLRDVLVVAEVAVSTVLVVAAGLLLQSLVRLQRVDPGFAPESVLKFELELPAARYPQSFATYPDWPEIAAFSAGLEERLAVLPGASAVGLANSHPLDAGWTTRFTVVGRPEVAEGEQEEIRIRAVSRDYFRAAGLALRRGRGFLAADRPGTPLVAVLNEAAVRRYFPGEDPLGREVRIFGTPRRIVGVVEDERFMGLAAEAAPALYPPLAQFPSPALAVLLRTAGDPLALAGAARAAVRDLDRQLAVFAAGTLEAELARSLAQPRFNGSLLAAFAALALVLAMVGVYGLLAYAVARRRQEIGVRMALGAGAGQVVRLVVGRGLALTLLGAALGLLGARAAGRLLAGLLYAVPADDPATFAAVPLLLAAAAVLASWVPARRAARVSPTVALRAD